MNSGYDFIPFCNLRDLASGVDLQSIRITEPKLMIFYSFAVAGYFEELW